MGSSPYGFEITQNCLICKLREAGFFCDLPNLDCRIGSESSTPEVTHRALYCLWKGSPRAASTSFARAGSSCPPPHHLTRRQDPDPAHCPGGKVLGLDATVPVNSTNYTPAVSLILLSARTSCASCKTTAKSCQNAYEMIGSLGLFH